MIYINIDIDFESYQKCEFVYPSIAFYQKPNKH